MRAAEADFETTFEERSELLRARALLEGEAVRIGLKLDLLLQIYPRAGGFIDAFEERLESWMFSSE